jgi:AraC-like DNA-binding protein
MFCHEGGGRLDLAGSHVMARGSLVQIPGWMVHRVRFQQDARYSALMFDAAYFPGHWTRSLEWQRVAPAVLTLPDLEPWFERWHGQPEELLPRLARRLPATELPDNVRSALALAHEAASRGGGVGEIADRLGYSLPYLTSQVTRYTGRSLGQWVQESRLDLAGMLLRGSAATVAQVAQQCGFADLSHFRRAFKKRTGHAPSQFQQEVKNEHI